jgi:hypothetical protein
MFRRFVVLVAVVAAVAAGASAAMADRSYHGPWETDLLVTTTSCPGFSADGWLSFYGDVNYSDAGKKYRFDGTESAGGFTYTLRAQLFGGVPTEGMSDFGSGNVTVRRSDGARMTGTARAYQYWDGPSTVFVDWLATPSCR